MRHRIVCLTLRQAKLRTRRGQALDRLRGTAARRDNSRRVSRLGLFDLRGGLSVICHLGMK